MMTLKDLFEPTAIEPDSETERTCGSCLERKNILEFYRDGKDSKGNDKYRRDCKDCYRKQRLSERKAKRKAEEAARQKVQAKPPGKRGRPKK